MTLRLPAGLEDPAALLLQLLSQKAELEVGILEREVAEDEADADTHRVYSFFDAMERDPVKNCIETVSHWVRRDEDKDITILLNSPGGWCVEGYALFDWLLAIRKLHRRKIEIIGLGQVSSMASVVIQAATHRVMHRNSWMLIHEVMADMPEGYYDRKISIIEEELNFAKRIELQGAKILAARSDLTVKEILKRTYKRDWWLSPKEALEFGFVDEVR